MKPLDLEEKKLIEDIILTSGILLRGGNDLVDYEIGKSEIDELLSHAIKEIKQRIKQACKFYLRYKDKPELLMKEYPEYNKDIETLRGDNTLKLRLNSDIFVRKYNEWLFKLTFFGDIEEVKGE